MNINDLKNTAVNDLKNTGVLDGNAQLTPHWRTVLGQAANEFLANSSSFAGKPGFCRDLIATMSLTTAIYSKAQNELIQNAVKTYAAQHNRHTYAAQGGMELFYCPGIDSVFPDWQNLIAAYSNQQNQLEQRIQTLAQQANDPKPVTMSHFVTVTQAMQQQMNDLTETIADLNRRLAIETEAKEALTRELELNNAVLAQIMQILRNAGAVA